MFERFVAQLLLRYLSSYVDLDQKRLQVSLLSGNLQLRNLALKTGALDDLDLPITIVRGQIGELHLQVPWSNIRNEPVIVTVSKVHVVLGPRSADDFDDKAHQAQLQALKRQKIEAANQWAQYQGAAYVGPSASGSGGTASRLSDTIVNNVQINVSDIHVRYEDADTLPALPFALGAVVEKLVIQSTTDDWKPAFVSSGASRRIFKVLDLKKFCIYIHPLKAPTTPASWASVFESPVARDVDHDWSYCLHPVNALVKLAKAIVSKPDPETLARPMLDVSVSIEQVALSLDHTQYQIVLRMLNHFSLRTRAARYRKHLHVLGGNAARPTHNPAAWWRFAITCVMSDIHESRRRWSWSHFAERRSYRLNYVYLYKLVQGLPWMRPPSKADARSLAVLEDQLDYDDIIFYRTIAQVEIHGERLAYDLHAAAPAAHSLPPGVALQQTLPSAAESPLSPGPPTPGPAGASTPAAASSSGGGGGSSWFSALFSGSGRATPAPAAATAADPAAASAPRATPPPGTPSLDDQAFVWTEADRAALFSVLRPDATNIISGLSLPAEYVHTSLTFRLDRVSLRLGTTAPQLLIASAALDDLILTTQLRPGNSSRIHAELGSLSITDGSTGRMMVSSQPGIERAPSARHGSTRSRTASSSAGGESQSTAGGEREPLLEMALELAPPRSNLDVALWLSLRPMYVLVLMPCVDSIVEFFSFGLHDPDFETVEDAARARVETAVQSTRNRIRYALASKRVLDLQLELSAPTIFVPVDRDNLESTFLLADFGHLAVSSDLPRHFPSEDTSLYDNFQLKLTGVDLAFLDGPLPVDLAAAARAKKISPATVQQLVESFDASLYVQLCALNTSSKAAIDTDVAVARVSGHMPQLRIHYDDRLHYQLGAVLASLSSIVRQPDPWTRPDRAGPVFVLSEAGRWEPRWFAVRGSSLYVLPPPAEDAPTRSREPAPEPLQTIELTDFVIKPTQTGRASFEIVPRSEGAILCCCCTNTFSREHWVSTLRRAGSIDDLAQSGLVQALPPYAPDGGAGGSARTDGDAAAADDDDDADDRFLFSGAFTAGELSLTVSSTKSPLAAFHISGFGLDYQKRTTQTSVSVSVASADVEDLLPPPTGTRFALPHFKYLLSSTVQYLGDHEPRESTGGQRVASPTRNQTDLLHFRYLHIDQSSAAYDGIDSAIDLEFGTVHVFANVSSICGLIDWYSNLSAVQPQAADGGHDGDAAAGGAGGGGGGGAGGDGEGDGSDRVYATRGSSSRRRRAGPSQRLNPLHMELPERLSLPSSESQGGAGEVPVLPELPEERLSVRFQLRLESVTIVMVNMPDSLKGDTQLVRASLAESGIDIRVHPSFLQISGRLGCLSVVDLAPISRDSPNREVIGMRPGETSLLEFQYTTVPEALRDQSPCDTLVTVYLHGAQIIYIHRFLGQILYYVTGPGPFFTILHTALAMRKAAAPPQPAKSANERPHRFLYWVLAKNPLAFIPRSPHSDTSLRADASRLVVCNELLESQGMLLERIHVTLTDIDLGGIFPSVGVQVVAARPLTAPAAGVGAAHVARWQIEVNVSDLHGPVTPAQYELLLGLFYENLAYRAPSSSRPTYRKTPTDGSVSPTDMDVVIGIPSIDLDLLSAPDPESRKLFRAMTRDLTLRYVSRVDGSSEMTLDTSMVAVHDAHSAMASQHRVLAEGSLTFRSSGAPGLGSVKMLSLQGMRVHVVVDAYTALVQYLASSPVVAIVRGTSAGFDAQTPEMSSSMSVSSEMSESADSLVSIDCDSQFKITVNDIAVYLLQDPADDKSPHICVATTASVSIKSVGGRRWKSIVDVSFVELSASLRRHEQPPVPLNRATNVLVESQTSEGRHGTIDRTVDITIDYVETSLVLGDMADTVDVLQGLLSKQQQKQPEPGGGDGGVGAIVAHGGSSDGAASDDAEAGRGAARPSKLTMNINTDGMRAIVLMTRRGCESPLLAMHLASCRVICNMVSHPSSPLTLVSVAEVGVEVHYFDAPTSSWQPLLEPWATRVEVATITGSTKLRLGVVSNETVNINVSHALIMSVLDLLHEQMWQENAGDDERYHPYWFRNETGHDVSLWADSVGRPIMVRHGQQVAYDHVQTGAVRQMTPLSSIAVQVGSMYCRKSGISVRSVSEFAVPIVDPIARASTSLVVNTTVERGSKRVVLRSSIVVVNETTEAFMVAFEKAMDGCPTVAPATLAAGGIMSVPLQFIPQGQLRLRPASDREAPWSSEVAMTDLVNLMGPGRKDKHQGVITLGEEQTCVCVGVAVPKIGARLVLHPPLRVRNLIPAYLLVSVVRRDGTTVFVGEVAPGGELSYFGEYHTLSATVEESTASGLSFAASTVFPDPRRAIFKSTEPVPLSVSTSAMTMTGTGRCSGQQLTLAVEADAPESGALRVALFAQFCVDNSNELVVKVKGAAGDGMAEVPGQGLGLFSSERVSMMVQNSSWSRPFGVGVMDAVGTVEVADGFTQQRQQCRVFELGHSVGPGPGAFYRTKVVRVYAQYALCNVSGTTLRIKQQGCKTWTELPSDGKRRAFHWSDKNRPRAACLGRAEWEWSAPFALDTLGDLEMKLRRTSDRLQCYVPSVQMAHDGHAVLVTIHPPARSPTYRIDNELAHPVEIRQECDEPEETVPWHKVMPQQSTPYAWDDPSVRPLRLTVRVLQRERTYTLDVFGSGTSLDEISTQFADGPTKVLVFHDRESSRRQRIALQSSEATMQPPKRPLAFAVSLEGVGVSLIDETTREIMYFGLMDVFAKVDATTAQQKMVVKVGRMQADNTDPRCQFPVVLMPAPKQREGEGGKELPCLQMAMVRCPTQPGLEHYAYVSVLLQEMQLKIEEEFIGTLVHFLSSLELPTAQPVTVATITPEYDPANEDTVVEELWENEGRSNIFGSFSPPPDGAWTDSSGTSKEPEEVTLPPGRWRWSGSWRESGKGWMYATGWKGPWHSETFMSALARRRRWTRKRVRVGDAEGAGGGAGGEDGDGDGDGDGSARVVEISGETGKVFVDLLQLHPIKLSITFATSVMRADAEPSRGREEVLLFFRKHVANEFVKNILNLDRAPLRLNALLMENVLASRSRLLGQVSKHYRRQVLSQIHTLVGSTDQLGNPIGFVNNLGTGIHDLFYEPAQGIVQSPEAFVEGLAKGASSFLRHSVVGTFNSASLVGSTVGRHLATLSFDDEFIYQRRMVAAPRSASQGIRAGLDAFGRGVFLGVTGIITMPVAELEKERSLMALLRGVGKGVVGIAIKPTTGVLDLATKTAEGIRNAAAGPEAEDVRLRPPRAMGGDGVVTLYSWNDAIGQEVLKGIDGRKYVDDEYRRHVCLDRVILFCTDRRTLLVDAASLREEWNVPHDKMAGIRVDGRFLCIDVVYWAESFVRVDFSSDMSELRRMYDVLLSEAARWQLQHSMFPSLSPSFSFATASTVTPAEPHFVPVSPEGSKVFDFCEDGAAGEQGGYRELDNHRVVEYATVYENQRRLTIFADFGAKSLLPTDPPQWASLNGDSVGAGLNDVSLPDESWNWGSEWKINYNRRCDAEGWEYAFSWGSVFDSVPRNTCYVRRREWVRMRYVRQAS